MFFVRVCGVQSFAMLFIEFILHQCFFVDLDHDFFNVLSPLLCTCSLLLLLTKWHLFQLLSKIKYELHYSMGWMKFSRIECWTKFLDFWWTLNNSTYNILIFWWCCGKHHSMISFINRRRLNLCPKWKPF